MKTKHLKFLNQTLEIAKTSVQKGNHPFGALIVLGDEVVVSSENEVISLNDVTAHAELRLVQKVQSLLPSSELERCVLYTSTEPCAMCAGAIYWAGINHVVFGCSTGDLKKVTKEGIDLKCLEVFKTGTREIKVEYFSTKEFIEIHEKFWIEN